jgi:hypothetical protein
MRKIPAAKAGNMAIPFQNEFNPGEVVLRDFDEAV